MKKLTKKQKQRVMCALSGKKYKFTTGTLHEIQGTKHAYCSLGAIAKEFTGKDFEGGSLEDLPEEDLKKIPAALRQDLPKNHPDSDLSNDVPGVIIELNDDNKSYKEAREWIKENL